MIKLTACLTAVIFPAIIYAQNVETLRASDFRHEGKIKDFQFVEQPSDTTQMDFVAALKVTGKDKKADVSLLYFKLKEKANDLGANAFVFNGIEKNDSLTTATFTATVFHASDTVLDKNAEKKTKNTVYIFGEINKSDKAISFKVDGEKVELQGGVYVKRVIPQDGEVKISKGGFTGAAMWLKWKENKPAVYLSLTGFGIGGGPVPAGMVGMSFNTGRINYIEEGLGRILLQLLPQP